jgi:hypothetical protein
MLGSQVPKVPKPTMAIAYRKKLYKLINCEETVVPEETFGVTWPLHFKDIHMPAHIENLKEHLKTNSLACLLIWSIANYCMDTTTGKVVIYPITVTTSKQAVKCVISHWSLLQQVMVNLFTGFRSGIKQKDIQSALSPFLVHNISKRDLARWVKVTGTKLVNKPRLVEHSHFLIPADLFISLAQIIEPFKTPHDFLFCEEKSTTNFCTDKTATIEKLKQQNLFISAYTVTNVFQSNTPNWLMLKVQPVEYDDNTPAFGVPFWNSVVNLQFDLFKLYHKKYDQSPHHMKSLFELASDVPIETRSVILERFPIGVLNDVPKARYSDHNQASKRRRKIYEEACDKKGLAMPARGRPRKGEEKFRTLVKNVRVSVEAASGIRPMKRNRVVDTRSNVNLSDVKNCLPETFVSARMTAEEIQAWLSCSSRKPEPKT